MEFYNDTYCVYMHTNKIDGKKYVGQTCQKTNERWKNGKGYENSTYFYNAILKYGWDNFEHEIIASNLTKEEADNFEALLIDKLDLMNRNKGYNLMSGGSGGRPSKEVLKKRARQ
nr:MAG TPA: intron associated endonuclease [Bacteriophage sp.]